MKKLIIVISAFYFVLAHVTVTYPGEQPAAGVRQPAFAGQFYPSDPDKLTRAIDEYLDTALSPLANRPIAIISPHAGYIYSGQIAADAYKQVASHDYDLVVILGVNHTTRGFRNVSIYPGGGYRTPLGVAEIDEQLAAELIAGDKDFTFFAEVHKSEHSIEVQVPFVQQVFPGVKILPAIVGTPDWKLCEKFGKALADAIEGRNALIVASCDLSHFPAYDDAEIVDEQILEAIANLDASSFRSTCRAMEEKGIPNLSTCACGEASVLTAMVAARKLGATNGRIISRANSGDTSVGDRSRVVGYGAVAIFKGSKSAGVRPVRPPAQELTGNVSITKDQKEALLSFARKTIRQLLTTDTAPLARGFDPILESKRGAFVTLEKNGRLRGCIGHMAEDLPLCQVVGYCAIQAAVNDRRFDPVDLDELAEIEIEISVLTPFQPVNGYEDIQIGRDGVVLEKNGRSAVYLPSVAVEQGWDREEMLSHLSVKAGLEADAWQKGARFFTFQANAFSESDHE